MSYDKAHFNSPAHQEADRMDDERDEAQERRDRLEETWPVLGPTSVWWVKHAQENQALEPSRSQED